MDLKYDVYTITNAEGSGEERKYVRLKQHEAMTASELEATIQQRCTLTKGDVQQCSQNFMTLWLVSSRWGAGFMFPNWDIFRLL